MKDSTCKTIDEQDLDWEEWDGEGSFIVHCIAGGAAGIVEHTATFPFDTVKTHMQSYCNHCPDKNTCTSTLRRISNLNGVKGFYRGVQTMIYGCAPAHALYFSSYEITKKWVTSSSSIGSNGLATSPAQQFMSPIQGALAGCVSTFFHDTVMTPMDTVKQRMQLGHYTSVGNGLSSIVKSEGFMALYRSLPVTLATNLPYGSIMFAVNEGLKDYLTSDGSPATIITYMIAGSGAGCIASSITTPLDRIKTKLQIQHLNSVIPGHHQSSLTSTQMQMKKGPIGTVMALHTNPLQLPACKAANAEILSVNLVKYQGISDALKSILKEEGAVGLFRGIIPRICSHTPAVAVSWTTYETVKHYLTSI